ncbi:MAG: chromosome segregation ATPase [Candidatus Paceibacteria bacterium]|jgi:chromosome segregation ATPase
MRLKSLEISGFKSFAKKSKLDFNAPISSIVGPNGSGKSNIAESFKFVLGEQSIKSLRGKKGEDLIFNGTGGAGRMNKAQVKIFLDNKERRLPLDFDEVSVERVVHRDGVNEYFLNGSLVRLKDITEILASANIGSTGHHIISQGEADKVLNASPKDRRSILEDALGLKVYQYKKVESEKKLKKTKENIEHVESLRKEIAPHLKFLKKQVAKVERGRILREELKGVYKEYVKRENVYITSKRSDVEGSLKEPKKVLSDINVELEKCKREIEDGRGQSNESSELISLEHFIQEVNGDMSDHTRRLGQVEGEISSLDRMKEKEKSRVLSEENKNISFNEVKELSSRLSEILDEGDGTEDISLIKSVLTKIRNTFKTFIEEYQSTSENVSNHFDDDLIKLEQSKKELVGLIEGFGLKMKQLSEKVNTIKKEIDDNKVGTLEAEKRVFELISRKSETESVINRLNIESDNLNRDEDEYKRELAEAGTLIGREILGFEDLHISKEEIMLEDRNEQYERRRKLEKMKIRVEELGGLGSDDVIREYQDANERDEFLNKEIGDLDLSAKKLQGLVRELDEKINVRFKEGIEKINVVFNEFFGLMFGGGVATLNLVKPEVKKKKSDIEELLDETTMEENQDEEEGVDISVNLPRKKIHGLMMLSGGERALTSIALLFAISSVNPPPFIILDETDAALDEANSKKYGDMIENLSKHSQLILITHNRETMSRASIIYGVTMESGISKLLSIRLDEGVQYAK